MTSHESESPVSLLKSIVNNCALKTFFGRPAPRLTGNSFGQSAWTRFELNDVYVEIRISQRGSDVEMMMSLQSYNAGLIDVAGVNQTVTVPSSSVQSCADRVRLIQKIAYAVDVLFSLGKCRIHVECDGEDLQIKVSFYGNLINSEVNIGARVSQDGAELIHVKTISQWTSRDVNRDYSTIDDFVALLNEYVTFKYTRAAMLERVCDVMLRLVV